MATADQVKANGNESRAKIPFYESGTSGLKQWSGFITQAYNTALYWPGVQPLYSRIRTSMPEIVMIRRAFAAWARNMEPIVDLPEKPTDDDKRYQDFIVSDFENMEGGSAQFLDTMVNHVPFYGWGWWEAVPGIRDNAWRPPPFVDGQGKFWPDEWRSEQNDRLIGMRKLAWRDTSTFYGWEFDGAKKMVGMVQQDFPNTKVALPKNKSLHLTFGDPNNPEGSSPLEAVWRLERIKYGLEVIQGIGFEHAAGHLKVQKTEVGTVSDADKTMIAQAAKNLLTAQEGNYGYFPFGIDANVTDIPFQAAGYLLDAIKHYSILVLSVYMMQTIALNTMTDTGAQASQVDSTNLAVFTFNAMMDGFASQYDAQVGRRLYQWNKDSFPGLTKRPNIRFSHIENNIDLGALGSFLSALNGILPLGEEDYKAFRKRTGFLPENNPELDDELSPIRTMDEEPKEDAEPKDGEPVEDKEEAKE